MRKSLQGLRCGFLMLVKELCFAIEQWRTQEFFSVGEGGGSTNSVEDRGRTERTGIWRRSPLVKGSGGSCKLVQEISFHIVKFS